MNLQQYQLPKGKHILCCDFETTTSKTKYYQKHKDVMVQLWVARDYETGKVLGRGTKIEDFFSFLKSLQKNYIIYFHNLSWDGNFIYKYLAKTAILVNKMDVKRDNIWTLFFNGSDIYQIEYMYYCKSKNNKNVYHKLTFQCSYRMLSASIESLGKDLGLLKIQKGWNHEKMLNSEPKETIDDYLKTKNGRNYVAYCENDTLIMREALATFQEGLTALSQIKDYDFYGYKIDLSFFERFKIYNRLTIGSLGYDMQKHVIYHNPWLRENDGEKKFAKNISKEIKKGLMHSIQDNELSDYFYSGGFTQFNTLYRCNLNNITKLPCENGMSIDVNSMHPSSMTKKLPYGQIYDKSKDNWETMGLTEDKVIEWYVIEIDGFESKKGFGTFPVIANWVKKAKILQREHAKKQKYREFNQEHFDKLWEDFEINKINPNARYFSDYDGKMIMYYLKEEWEELQNCVVFHNPRIIKIYWNKAFNYSKLFIELLYSKRQEFKALKQDAKSLTYKILLNCSYGIHGKRAAYTSAYICDSLEQYEGLDIGSIIDIEIGDKVYPHIVVNKSTKICKIPNNYVVEIAPLNVKKANNKFIAAAICAYSRINLFSTIRIVGIPNSLYCDTDSIYIKNYDLETRNKLNSLNLIHKTELGKWDEEQEFSFITIIGAKRYEIFDKDGNKITSKCAGVAKTLLKGRDATFDNCDADGTLRGGSLKKEETPSGLVLIEKDIKLKDGNS